MAKSLYDEKSIEETGLQEGQAADNNQDREVDEESLRRTASQYDHEKYQYQKSRNDGESASGYNIEQTTD
ncbi:hypothetical protein [Bacillus sp. UNC438CL73TsuS30]|uniref:hypothetical protein n=1 Tax=Bacillus sp. UNC438CL73TsuS30 TaxID=1340434 RepID=UPI00047D8887|nr:hypothetical protein [Bacillus sp. UNC438CL73TsuS30]